MLFRLSSTPSAEADITYNFNFDPASSPQTQQVANSVAVAAPIGLAATTVANRIDLTWNPSPGATYYSVKRATTSGGPYQILATDVSGLAFGDSEVPDGAPYFYIVTAGNASAESIASTEISATALGAEDVWRLTHFGTTAATGSSSDDVYPDGDGWDNISEYISSTHPTDPSSQFRITNLVATDGDYIVSFPTIEGRHYKVEATDDLATTSWEPVLTEGVPAANLPGTGNNLQVTDSGGALHSKRFYRIIVTK